MNEILFIEKNKSAWQKLSELIEGGKRSSTQELVRLYSKTSDDLSYARTHYPGSRVVVYLNSLVLNAHRRIYKNRYGNWSGFYDFWARDIPLAAYRHRNKIAAAFAFFLISFAIGWFSSSVDESFTRLVLGDTYVNMTEQNIDKGDPLAVYGQMSQSEMFLGIGVNNIRVAFLAFILGIFTSIGTALVLLYNGVMVGTFFYFFYKVGIAPLAWSSIMIHGTLELSAIAISGGAGFVIGQSFLFPGTYTRLYSLRKGAADGIKIMIALIPVFVAAAFLESFLTREYQSMTMMSRMAVILISLFFLTWYFYYYANRTYEKWQTDGLKERP